MKATDYDYLSDFLLDQSGLALGSGKEYLLEARLVPLAQSWGLTDFDELIAELRKGKDARLVTAVTETMTTNETSFFRDKTPFDDLRERILPKLIEARRDVKKLKIWSAAASTGQEIYSLLMLLDESFPELKSWKIEILGTDIAQTMLDRAQEGIFSQFEVQRGLPTPLLIKNFEQVSSGWQIKREFPKRAYWKQLNLLDQFQHLGKFDLVMCRNVLIYFETDNKRDVLERVHRLAEPDGFLMLGAAESIVGITDVFERFRSCKSATYTPK